MKQLEIFQESSFESPSFDDKSLPRPDVVDHSVINRLLQFSDAVVNVQLWIPVLAQINRFSPLCVKNQQRHIYIQRQ